MPSIIHEKRSEITREITEGDVFYIPDRGIYIELIAYHDSTGYALLDMEDRTIIANQINHQAHAMNYVKKHYGDFRIIPGDKVEIKIKE